MCHTCQVHCSRIKYVCHRTFWKYVFIHIFVVCSEVLWGKIYVSSDVLRMYMYIYIYVVWNGVLWDAMRLSSDVLRMCIYSYICGVKWSGLGWNSSVTGSFHRNTPICGTIWPSKNLSKLLFVCLARTERCDTLQHTATHCNTLQHTATHCNALHCTTNKDCDYSLFASRDLGAATHCNILQYAALHYKQGLSSQCVCPARTGHCSTMQHTATHCNALQRTATHCNTLQHTALHHRQRHYILFASHQRAVYTCEWVVCV